MTAAEIASGSSLLGPAIVLIVSWLLLWVFWRSR